MSTDANTSPGQIAGGTTSWPPASGDATPFDPTNVNLAEVLKQDLVRDVICYFNAGDNEYEGPVGVRVSSLFVKQEGQDPEICLSVCTSFGAGVIVATAFIHLLDPAYEEIGPASCVGMTGGWAEFSWVPALALASEMLVFLMDFGAERYVEKKYGLSHGTPTDLERVGTHRGSVDAAALRYETGRKPSSHQHLHSGDVDPKDAEEGSSTGGKNIGSISLDEKEQELIADRSFRQQIAAFLILEFGVIFHSVIIGLTLGSAGRDEFAVLYPVIVFHQSFEGLGIGARLSAIPFPKRLRWLPYWLCAGYGLTTPIAIAVGIGLRTTYNPASLTANIVSGVLDSISAGILLYTGFVELLARDFLFNPDRTNDDRQLTFMICCVLLGAGVMSLLGKWA
ncbi:putative zinc/iron permease [Septoria linicola]|nr:putative zinc/iron permease [Septoria linicola]